MCRPTSADRRNDYKLLKINSIVIEEDVSEFPGPISASSPDYHLASKLNLNPSRSETGSILMILFLFIGSYIATSMQANSFFMTRIAESQELRTRVRCGRERMQRKRRRGLREH